MRVLGLGLLFASAALFTGCAGCDNADELPPGSCVQSSDCEDGETCVSGTCTLLGGEDGGNWWERDGGSGDDGGTATDGGGGTAEVCGNGLDDTGDGLIDEGCGCTDGQSQGCWPGTPRRRGVGACRDGAQRCVVYGDLWSWGSCEGAVLPSSEVPDNGIDEDCDGTDGTTPCNSELPEVCDNNTDDNCNGLTDCEDPGCRLSCPSCDINEGGCGNSVDEDCDGLTDCDDPECGSDLLCQGGGGTCTPQFPYLAEIACRDTLDNDCDGDTDCGDKDCKTPGRCGCDQSEGTCNDNEDNDCDGHTDCEDADCETCAPGSTRWCDEPSQCLWGTQECGSDGRWGPCYETSTAPSGCNADGLYNRECCVAAGECCENYPTDQSSVGTCDGVVTAACE